MQPLRYSPQYSALPIVLAISFICCPACDPKPVSEIPSISGTQAPDRSDRPTPDPNTVATIFELLDPRGVDLERLERQRNEFETRMRALITDPEEQKTLELFSLIRWHRLYTSRLREHQRVLGTARKQAKSILKPGRGFVVTIDDSGAVKQCRRPSSTPKNDGLQMRLGMLEDCKLLPSYAQLDYQLEAASSELRSVLEAQWHLIERIERIRHRLKTKQTSTTSTASSP